MKNTIAIMNTKGGVGKSTVTLGIAETLSVYHGKSVLVIDSDAQASVSYMLAGPERLTQLQEEGRTVVALLEKWVLKGSPVNWQDFVIRNVSDVDDARSVSLMAGDAELTLIERAVSKSDNERALRRTISALLNELRSAFDVILIDCAPGLSVVTESWLREADFYVSPTRPDYISACGLMFFRRFKSRNPEMGFAENLGVLISMKDQRSALDAEFERWLRNDPQNFCFETTIPRSHSMQYASGYSSYIRSYYAKYPADAGQAMRGLAEEILQRLARWSVRDMNQASQLENGTNFVQE